MATPKRRSSRLRGQTPQKEDYSSATPATLSTLIELEETPEPGTRANIDDIASPMPGAFPTSAMTPSRQLALHVSSPVRTPSTAGAIKPSRDEMHPKHFQSTTKKLESGMRLGNANTRIPLSSPIKPSTVTTGPAIEAPKTNPFSSPTFEFRCKRPSTDMSSDAQKMMEEVRDQAAKIKVQLEAERDEQARKDGDAHVFYGLGGRKMATPKGKVGRFSDVHMAHFKNMDSIANHPSSFRADPSRFPSASKSLKRTNSKAGLDQADSSPKRTMPTTNAKSSQDDGSASPAKRFKQRHEETLASSPKPTTPTSLQRSKSGIPTPTRGTTTPTAASLARSNSTKSLHNTTSKIPTSLARSPSTKALLPSPSIPKTDAGANHKFRNPFVKKLNSMKSILRKPNLRFSEDPVKLAAGTHVSPHRISPEKQPEASPYETPSKKKVNFSSSPDIITESVYTGHSEKVSTSVDEKKPESSIPVSYPPLYPLLKSLDRNSLSQDTDTITTQSSLLDSPTTMKGEGPNRTTTLVPLAPPGPSGPGDFTFRFPNPSTRAISFASPPKSFQEGFSKKTIRAVRASDAAVMKPSQSNSKTTCGEKSTRASIAALPSGTVPHGLSNKKRKRETADEEARDEDNKENKTFDTIAEEGNEDDDGHSPSKKPRLNITSPTIAKSIGSTSSVTGRSSSRPTASRKSSVSVPSSRARSGKPSPAVSNAGNGAVAGPRGRGVVSLSRLQALARPKERK